MRQLGWILKGAVAIGVLAGVGQTLAQTASPAPNASVAPTAGAPAEAVVGGRLHGVVKSGNITLPGVTVTAQNTLTGKRYSTTTGMNGAWSMTIPQNGRYVIRTEFAAFAPASDEAVLNDTGRDRTVNFQLTLASRAAEQEQQQARQNGGNNAIAQAVQQLTGNGAESLSLVNALNNGAESAGGASGAGGAELPSVAGNSDFGGESVNINGQSGQVSPLAGLDMDRVRDAVDSARVQGGGPGGQTGSGGPGSGGLLGGGMLGGGSGMMGPGGGGGFFGGAGGMGGGGRGNFRGFNPAQPHGAIFWTGNNAALNAQPFSLRGQSQQQPASGSNRFGLTLMTAPYLPGLTKPSGKDTVFASLSGQRSSSPQDLYATVPTLAQRGGDFSGAGLPAIYNPATGQQFVYYGTSGPQNNVIPPAMIAPQATALLLCASPNCQPIIPYPNLTGTDVASNYNYHLLTTAQSNTTQAGLRYMRSLGANATQPGSRGMGGFGRRSGGQNQGLRQSINFNYNWAHSASDSVNVFPQLGGKSASDSYALQAGYTVGYNRLTSISNVGWNRSNSHRTNFFTDSADNVGLAAGVDVPNQVPLNYGLPNVTLSNITGLSETQPNFSISQTISFSEVLSWRHGKHNMRYGGDYRRVHNDFLAGSNATGSYAFTGWYTEAGSGLSKDPKTGSALADFLLGLPQSTNLNSSLAKSYLRDNVFDAYATDDWRVLPILTLEYGVRYEFFAPYTEKYGRLAMVDTDPNGAFANQQEVNAGGIGPVSGLHLPSGLVYPWHKAFAPRVGFALRLPKSTVLRSGFGMNYTVGEYATFARTMAHQPPFTNEQTNNLVDINGNVAGPCAQATIGQSQTPGYCFTNGFPAAATVGNYALDPHYGLPYMMAWNLDLQKTLPWGIVMNAGYNGSRADHMDMESYPRALAASRGTNPGNLVFTYDQASGFYKMNAGTLRLNKRLTHGVSMGANYQFSHAIDNASSVNGSSGSVAQDWLDLAAQEGNSALLPRQKVQGTYLFELPFGQDKKWVTTGAPSHVLEGFSVSGDFTFASGGWLTPTVAQNFENVSCGTQSALRADLLPGASVTAGGGSLRHWFNTAAYQAPSVNAAYPCGSFGDAPRNSIEGPGTVQNDMSLSKTMQLGDTRSMEIRSTMSNVFNTVQYTAVDTTVGSPTFGQVTSAGNMRSFQFLARFRF